MSGASGCTIPARPRSRSFSNRLSSVIITIHFSLLVTVVGGYIPCATTREFPISVLSNAAPLNAYLQTSGETDTGIVGVLRNARQGDPYIIWGADCVVVPQVSTSRTTAVWRPNSLNTPTRNPSPMRKASLRHGGKKHSQRLDTCSQLRMDG
jgi:hypothetical protein